MKCTRYIGVVTRTVIVKWVACNNRIIWLEERYFKATCYYCWNFVAATI